MSNIGPLMTGGSEYFDELVHKGIKMNAELVEPTADKVRTYKQVIHDYIKEHKRILYGGTAIHFLIESKGQKGIYEGEDDFDYDFYSPDPIGDSIKICNIMFDKGFPMVKRQVAMSGLTFKIAVNTNIDIADISYIPEKIYNELPTYVTVNGITCIHPEFIKIDQLKSLLDYPASLYRWDKDYLRMTVLEKLYPIKSLRYGGHDNYESGLIVPQKMIKTLYDKFIIPRKTELVLTGTYAYNYYIGTVPRKVNDVGKTGGDDYTGKIEKTNVEFYEVISIRPKRHLELIANLIRDTANVKHSKYTLSDFSIYCHANFMKMMGKRWIITYCHEPIITIIEPSYRVLATKSDGKVNITDYHGTIQYYSIMKYLDNENLKEYNSKITDLQNAYNKYHEANKKIKCTDPTNPYQIFQISGIETYYSPEIKVKFSGKLTRNYLPEAKRISVPEEEIKDYYVTELDPELDGGSIRKYKIDEYLDENAT